MTGWDGGKLGHTTRRDWKHPSGRATTDADERLARATRDAAHTAMVDAGRRQGYRLARGAAPPPHGAPSPEEAIRRGREGDGPRPLTDAERHAAARESLNRLRLTPGALDIDYCTVADALDELAALRAEVARLEAENGRLRGELREGHVGQLHAELARAVEAHERLSAALDGLIADVEHFARIYHGALHNVPRAAWRECDQGGCPGLRRAVERAAPARGGSGE